MILRPTIAENKWIVKILWQQQDVIRFSQYLYFQLWLVSISYFIILFWAIRNWQLNNCKIICKNILCEYNNITLAYKYLKGKTKRVQTKTLAY